MGKVVRSLVCNNVRIGGLIADWISKCLTLYNHDMKEQYNDEKHHFEHEDDVRKC